jgi:alpha-L-fucosidase
MSILSCFRTLSTFMAASCLVSVCVLAHASPTIHQSSSNSVDPHANETKAQRDARMHWWRQARFGMFIHWGLYSVPAGVYKGKPTDGAGEWIMHDMQIPVDYYADYARQFDPEKFNATQWVSYAKAAGMKYIVMTAKHHEGFTMYPTKVDDWSLQGRTVFKRDPIAEMSSACKKAGIRFGVYYSQNLDWHHPGGGTAGPAWDDKQKGDFHDYIRKVSAPQVKELLTQYKPAVLWWDINADLTPAEVHLLTEAFPSVPGLIANNRLGGGVPGDTETPEQRIPATGFKGRDWETCMTMNDTWGYKSTDLNFKSKTTLIHNLVDIASKGGNYLLNVGPTSEGLIPDPEVERLKEVGEWMKVNGDSIYATTASPYQRLPFDGRATVKGNLLYLNVFNWPASGLLLPGLETAVEGVKSVATGQKLSFSKQPDGSYLIEKPNQIDPDSTAIVLKLKEVPKVSEPEVLATPNASGNFVLNAADANLAGSLQVEGGSQANIGFWVNQTDAASWRVNAPSSGGYQVWFDYSCEPSTGGSQVGLKVDGNPVAVTGMVAATAGWQDYRSMSLSGSLSLSAGKHTIQVYAVSKPGFAVMNLRRVTLTLQK